MRIRSLKKTSHNIQRSVKSLGNYRTHQQGADTALLLGTHFYGSRILLGLFRGTRQTAAIFGLTLTLQFGSMGFSEMV